MTTIAAADSGLPRSNVIQHSALQGANHVDWRAIFAGALAAAAISVLLLGFGSAIGLSLTSARPYAGLSATLMALLITFWFAIVHVGSFAAGGYLAARLRASTAASAAKGAPNVEREFRDGAHGFLVWALGTLLGAALIAGSIISIGKGTAEVAASAVSAGAAQTASNRAGGSHRRYPIRSAMPSTRYCGDPRLPHSRPAPPSHAMIW